MRLPALLFLLALAGCAGTADTTRADLDGALRGCETWVLDPASWSAGPAPFIAKVGLGDRMGPVPSVDEASLPPPPLRLSNRYWRINSSEKAGFVLVVSDRLPMCHVTGGGDIDMQPAVEDVLASEGFRSRWRETGGRVMGDMRSTDFKNREDDAFSLTVSRATQADARRDRVQMLATATYAMRPAAR